MPRLFRWSLLAIALILPAVPAAAQTAPNPESVTLAREMLAKMSGDPAVTIRELAGPMVGMLQQMGIQDPEQARALVAEVIIPVITSHYGALEESWAKGYASVLSVDDMKAAIAFYGSPAGQSLVAAGPKLARVKMITLTQWMAGLAPEIQQKVEQAIKAHGGQKN
jgi:hypothetical protein